MKSTDLGAAHAAHAQAIAERDAIRARLIEALQACRLAADQLAQAGASSADLETRVRQLHRLDVDAAFLRHAELLACIKVQATLPADVAARFSRDELLAYLVETIMTARRQAESKAETAALVQALQSEFEGKGAGPCH